MRIYRTVATAWRLGARQHHDGQVAPAAMNLSDQFPAAHFWHREVRNDQIDVMPRGGNQQCVRWFRGCDHTKAARLQSRGQRLENRFVVVDQQDGLAHSSRSLVSKPLAAGGFRSLKRPVFHLRADVNIGTLYRIPSGQTTSLVLT